MEDRWEKDAQAAAFKIVPLLNGMPLGQAKYALELTERWLLTTHRVDAQNAELIAAVEESENVLLR
jgi:hypothetical protein